MVATLKVRLQALGCQTVQLTKRFDTSKHNDGDIASGSSVYSKFIVFWNRWDNWLEGTRGV